MPELELKPVKNGSPNKDMLYVMSWESSNNRQTLFTLDHPK